MLLFIARGIYDLLFTLFIYYFIKTNFILFSIKQINKIPLIVSMNHLGWSKGFSFLSLDRLSFCTYLNYLCVLDPSPCLTLVCKGYEVCMIVVCGQTPLDGQPKWRILSCLLTHCIPLSSDYNYSGINNVLNSQPLVGYCEKDDGTHKSRGRGLWHPLPWYKYLCNKIHENMELHKMRFYSMNIKEFMW